MIVQYLAFTSLVMAHDLSFLSRLGIQVDLCLLVVECPRTHRPQPSVSGFQPLRSPVAGRTGALAARGKERKRRRGELWGPRSDFRPASTVVDLDERVRDLPDVSRRTVAWRRRAEQK